MKKYMKIGHSITFLAVVLLVASGFFFFFRHYEAAENRILLQSLDCNSEKIDKSITDLASETKTVDALVAFDRTPINDELRKKIEDMDIKIDDTNWILDYGRLEIPTASLCELVKLSQITKIFIPNQQYGITVNQ
jgi:hypothetical protein